MKFWHRFQDQTYCVYVPCHSLLLICHGHGTVGVLQEHTRRTPQGFGASWNPMQAICWKMPFDSFLIILKTIFFLMLVCLRTRTKLACWHSKQNLAYIVCRSPLEIFINIVYEIWTVSNKYFTIDFEFHSLPQLLGHQCFFVSRNISLVTREII